MDDNGKLAALRVRRKEASARYRSRLQAERLGITVEELERNRAHYEAALKAQASEKRRKSKQAYAERKAAEKAAFEAWEQARWTALHELTRRVSPSLLRKPERAPDDPWNLRLERGSLKLSLEERVKPLTAEERAEIEERLVELEAKLVLVEDY